MKKRFEKVSKTLIASLVIFQLSFATAAIPVVSLAFEGEEKIEAIESVSTETKEEVEVVKEEGSEEKIESTDTSVETEEESSDDTSTETEDPAANDNNGETGVSVDETNTATLAVEESAPITKGAEPKDPPKDGGVCDTEGNILVNGGFENPAVENYSWNIYSSIPGWTVSWMPGSGEDYDPNFELQRGLWTAYDGEQYIELDSDFDGPEGTIFDEAGSTKISQVIDTVPGVTYTVKFAFSARPGTPASDNHMALYIDDVVWDDSINTDGSSNADTEWFVFTREFTAADYTTTISFADIGDADSYGTFIDDVSVSCDYEPEDPEECPEGIISARINFSKVAKGAQVNGWRNWGEGDLAPQVFVGGNTAAHQYDDEEWFPLTNPDGSYINDPDIASYRDVKGLAVQRMEGKIRVVLYGYHPAAARPNGSKAAKPVEAGKDEPSSKIEFDEVVSETQSKEFAQFGLQLSHEGFGPQNSQISPLPWAGDMSPMGGWSNDGANPRIHDVTINDASNPMDGRGDYGAYINQYNPRFDRMRVYDPYRVHSVLVVTTGSDGFYASYDVTPDSEEDCDSEDDDPVITLPPLACIETSVTSYDFLNLPGVTVTGGEGNVTLTVNQTGVQFGVPGQYTVTYTATDSNGNIDEEMMLITIGKCDNGNGGDEENPVLTVPSNACLETSVQSFDFMVGVSATDDGGSGNVTIVNDGATVVDFGTVGSYLVTYTATDSDGNTDTETRTINIAVDCDNGNGGDGASPVINVVFACVLTDALSYDFATAATSTDAEDGALTETVDSSLVAFGTAGTYDVTFEATDSDNNTTTVTVPFTISETCGGTGGGDDENPTISVPGQVCLLNSVLSFDFMSGVSASDNQDGDLTGSIVLDGEETVLFGTNGTYGVNYSVTDSDSNMASASRTIAIQDECDNGGNGGDDDNGGNGGNGGGSSGGSRRNAGEVLGANVGPACVRFTEYHDTGDMGGEIKALQIFLNAYLGTSLVVDGVYDRATTQAVHDFQAMHWDDIIDPWTPPLSPNTTGREYKTTRAAINAIIDCPETAIYLEDPMVFFTLTEVKNQKDFGESKIADVVSALAEVQGVSIEK